MINGWSSEEFDAAADTARVSARAYGVDARTFACALMMRDAAMSSIARVIFLVAWTERICRR